MTLFLIMFICACMSMSEHVHMSVVTHGDVWLPWRWIWNYSEKQLWTQDQYVLIIAETLYHCYKRFAKGWRMHKSYLKSIQYQAWIQQPYAIHFFPVISLSPFSKCRPALYVYASYISMNYLNLYFNSEGKSLWEGGKM